MKYRKGFVANISSSSFIYKIKITSFVKEDQLEEFIEFIKCSTLSCTVYKSAKEFGDRFIHLPYNDEEDMYEKQIQDLIVKELEFSLDEKDVLFLEYNVSHDYEDTMPFDSENATKFVLASFSLD